MEERPEDLEKPCAADHEEDDSPKGVAENISEAGKAVSLTIILGIAGLFFCIGAAIVFIAFFDRFDPASYYSWRASSDLAALLIKLFGLLFFLAGAGYAFRKFSLKNVQKGVYWFMGVLVAVMAVATAAVTLAR